MPYLYCVRTDPAAMYSGNPLICQIEVSRYTDSSYWQSIGSSKERRYSRFTGYESYHESFEKAKECLMKRLADSHLYAQKQIDMYQKVEKQTSIALSECETWESYDDVATYRQVVSKMNKEDKNEL